jgi:osomolarity two-component system, sensor histidine kinase NIK1
MQISLQGINSTPTQPSHSVDLDSTRSPTSPHSPYPCPTCRRPLAKSGGTQAFSGISHTNGVVPSPNGSPLVVPPGPLSAAAFESGLSAVEELRLLKAQVQDVARVCKAVADGDLTQKIEVGVQGPVMVQLKDVINSMVDKLGQFAKEVTRVSLEVGTEGRLGGQAVVVGVQGKWQELTDVVNRLAANLSTQVRSIAIVTTAVARGDLSQMIEVDAKGEILALKVCAFSISNLALLTSL